MYKFIIIAMLLLFSFFIVDFYIYLNDDLYKIQDISYGGTMNPEDCIEKDKILEECYIERQIQNNGTLFDCDKGMRCVVISELNQFLNIVQLVIVMLITIIIIGGFIYEKRPST